MRITPVARQYLVQGLAPDALWRTLGAARRPAKREFALGAEAGHSQSLRTGCRLPKAIGLWPMAARRVFLMSAPRPAEAGRPPRGSSKVAKPHFLESVGREALDEGLSRHGRDPHALVQILRETQDQTGWLSRALLAVIAHELKLSLAHVEGVAGFYR